MLVIVLLASLAAACARSVATALPPPTAVRQAVPAADATTLHRKLLFGYQGWFGCPGDGSLRDRWQHWFRGGSATAATLRVDMWPDLSELPERERCPTSLTMPDGTPAQLYSAYRPAAVDMHFRWLREYDLPGVFLQRFTVNLDDDSMRDFRDTVARNVRTASESHGRVFAVMYDISGHRPETLVEDVQRDWTHVVDTLRLLESPRYLRHAGRPVLAIWGFGFTDRPAAPQQAARLIEFFKNNPDPRYRVTLFGGIPVGWRTLTRDSQADPAWAAVYRAFDIISPWAVGRFRDSAGIERFYADAVAADLQETRELGIEYMPVVFPGFSWHNMNPSAPFNPIPRLGGRFYWRQVQRALQLVRTWPFERYADQATHHAGQGALHAGHHDQAVRSGERLACLEQPVQPGDTDVRDAGDSGAVHGRGQRGLGGHRRVGGPRADHGDQAARRRHRSQRHGAGDVVDCGLGNLGAHDRPGLVGQPGGEHGPVRMTVVQGAQDPDDLLGGLALAVDDLGIARPRGPVDVDARVPQVGSALVQALVRSLGHARQTIAAPGGRSLRLVAGVRAQLVRRGDALVHQVGDHALGRVLEVVAVVHPDAGVVGDEGDLEGLALLHVERVEPPRAAGRRLAVA